MVTLTIDGVEVTVERGTSILEAAQKAGVRIPTLCHDKRLIPYGSCRLCVVEVTARGKTRTMPACFNPARDGMQVATHTPKLAESRKMQLLLLLRSHPLLCPSCDAAGNCQLQNLVHEYELPDLPFPRESRYFHVDNESNFIRFNMNLCIRCGMCVRICEEVQGQRELSFIRRGITSEVSTDFGRALDCEFCGQCASICPVGAISSKWLVGTGREFELKKTDTTCSFCSLGCTVTLGEKDGKIVYVSSPADSPNEGNLCVKGRYGWPYVYSEKCLTQPLVRKDGRLQEVGWNEALSFVGNRLSAIKGTHGATSIGALGSERLTNEEAYVFNRFARTVLETPHLDHAGGYGYRVLVDGLGASLGYPASTNSLREIRKAKVILLFGADLTESHPVAKNEVVVAAGRHRAEVLVIDSCRTKLTDLPGMFLPVRPGGEALVANAMLKCIIDEGLYDKAALTLRAEGLDELTASLADYRPEEVAKLTGLSAESILKAAKTYAQAPSAVIILTAGMNRLGGDVALARAAANLALVTGHIGKEASGVFALGEKANAQGAIDMGLLPGFLPGFAAIADEAARSRFEAAWGSPLPQDPGMSAEQMLGAAQTGSMKALYVVGENPLDTYPDRVAAEQALKNLEFLVVQDMFLTSTAQLADAVLPVTPFIGKTGTFTSADRRVQCLRPSSFRPTAKTDLEIFTALAALLGKPAMTYSGPQTVMEEIASLVDVYGGISYNRLSDHGLCWPCVDAEDPGKAILYEGGFPGNKARLLAAPELDTGFSGNGAKFYLVPVVLKFHSGSLSTWSASLLDVSPSGVAEMHPKDLLALGLKDGDTAKISVDAGESLQVPVMQSHRAVEGTVIVPYHFPALKVNALARWNAPTILVNIEKA
jgi:formate dehydrogenase (NADP+) alpha subunit